ncbi:hypothetical protein BLAT2472_20078 [Burkholderia latens]
MSSGPPVDSPSFAQSTAATEYDAARLAHKAKTTRIVITEASFSMFSAGLGLGRLVRSYAESVTA